MDHEELIARLKSFANPKNVAGMARFGINANNTLGIPIPILRKLAKETGKNHTLACKLWQSGIHEARILAGFIGDAKLMTEKTMDSWASEFDSWDVCDQVCGNLFDKTSFAFKKAVEWTKDKREFVKRAGFAMMATLAVHDKKAKDEDFIKFFSIIKREANDERNYVRKAVNWALRQIGKRNKNLNKEAIKVAKDIFKLNTKSARWIAGDALRELSKHSKYKILS